MTFFNFTLISGLNPQLIDNVPPLYCWNIVNIALNPIQSINQQCDCHFKYTGILRLAEFESKNIQGYHKMKIVDYLPGKPRGKTWKYFGIFIIKTNAWKI